MRTLVLGGGAIGSTIAGYLARDGEDVTLADGWFHHVEAIRRRGLLIEAVEGGFAVPVEAVHLDEVESCRPADVIVLACKSYDTPLHTLIAREIMTARAVVLSAQNGMNDWTIAGKLGADRVLACVVAMGADLVEPACVHRTSAIDLTAVTIGPIDPAGGRQDLTAVHNVLAPLGRVGVARDIWPERWGKLALNTMVNAVAGLTGLRSHELWSHPAILDVIAALGHETACVAQASGVTAAPVLGRITHADLLGADRVGNAAWSTVVSTMAAIGGARVGRRENRASLLQDVEKKRRTEIRHLNGWVAERGAELGVLTPTHRAIVPAVEAVERGERRPAVDNARELVDGVGAEYA